MDTVSAGKMSAVACSQDINDAMLRAGLYRTLAQACSYPEPEAATALLAAWTSQLSRWQAGWPDGVQQLVLDARRELQQASLPELCATFVQLFGPAARCPMTETAWGDTARLLGKPAQIADIAGFYRAFGLQPTEGATAAPEDHLVTELEFMSILYLKETWALYAGLKEQLAITRDARNKFLEQHLAAWIHCWAKQMLLENPYPFYQALARLLRTLVESECQSLGLAPRTIDARVPDTEVGGDGVECPHHS